MLKIRKITSQDLGNLGDYSNDGIRQLRKPLLEAFDIYKSNVTYGVEVETEEEHLEIMAWYQQLLNLNTQAVDNIPTKIQRYL